MKKTITSKIFDTEPQLVSVEDGAEPSLRQILMDYYLESGISLNVASDLTNNYIQMIMKELQK